MTKLTCTLYLTRHLEHHWLKKKKKKKTLGRMCILDTHIIECERMFIFQIKIKCP